MPLKYAVQYTSCLYLRDAPALPCAQTFLLHGSLRPAKHRLPIRYLHCPHHNIPLLPHFYRDYRKKQTTEKLLFYLLKDSCEVFYISFQCFWSKFILASTHCHKWNIRRTFFHHIKIFICGRNLRNSLLLDIALTKHCRYFFHVHPELVNIDIHFTSKEV